MLAKTALLSGRAAARRLLRRHGGVLQHEDGGVEVIAPATGRAAAAAGVPGRGVTTRDPLDYGWWLASRSAGLVAYALLSAAVLLGLAMALRLGSPRLRREARGAARAARACSPSARPPRTGCSCSPTRGCGPA